MPHPFTSQKDQIACIHNSFMLVFRSNDKSKTRGRWRSTWLQHRPLTDPGCLILHWRSCWMMTSDNVNVSLIRITIRRAGLSGRGLHPTLRAWKREWPGECRCTVLLANITQGIPNKRPALIIPEMIFGKDVWFPTKRPSLENQMNSSLSHMFMKSELLGCDKGAHPRNDCFWLQVQTSILETQTSDSFTLF